MNYSIQIDEITKSFNGKKVLESINISIEKGEIFGLLGPSGAGKTTLIKILTGQLAAEHGTAVINGINSQQLKGIDYRNFGIMMDNFGVYERLSCFDNLKIFARIYKIKDEKIYKALADVSLESATKTAAGNLSKGMKSRLRLARVFMIEPAILFLDEPTSGLDPATAEDIGQMILSEKAKGKTIFLTTHNMAEAEKLCDHIALLNDGKIIEYGTPKEICRRYNHQKRLLIHLFDGTDKVILHEPDAADLLCKLMKDNMIETIHSSEPNLESVFMELTGKELSV
ncbi:MAG: ABC transporter ATP-binding protein [Lachnospiraceae bacterium]|nr:ABC transporter ATP-binding protein [Lachnospiraceae bacterium]